MTKQITMKIYGNGIFPKFTVKWNEQKEYEKRKERKIKINEHTAYNSDDNSSNNNNNKKTTDTETPNEIILLNCKLNEFKLLIFGQKFQMNNSRAWNRCCEKWWDGKKTATRMNLIQKQNNGAGDDVCVCYWINSDWMN